MILLLLQCSGWTSVHGRIVLLVLLGMMIIDINFEIILLNNKEKKSKRWWDENNIKTSNNQYVLLVLE